MIPTPRATAHRASIEILNAAGALRRAKRRIAAEGSVVVLTFHRVVPDDERPVCRSPRGMVLRESLFRKLIDHLSATACVISPQDIDRPSSPGARPRILLTFDDGWIDNIEVALPYLTAAKMHAYFFVATSFVGRSNPFWPERVQGLLHHARTTGSSAVLNTLLHTLQADSTASHPVPRGPETDESLLTWLKQFPAPYILRWIDKAAAWLSRTTGLPIDPSSFSDPRERLMTWDDLRSLVSTGHSIGSHTCTHALLPNLHPDDLAYELLASRRALRERLPLQRTDRLAISYPNGSSSPEVTRATSEAGYRFGFSNGLGLVHEASDLLLLPRINVWDGTITNHHGIFCEKQLDYAFFWKTLLARTTHLIPPRLTPARLASPARPLLL